uniref:Signal recognition particle 14 kDa protein n=1 Tax=Suricata suricatta TaxID=37032 RepID=A0A673U2F3_SURSU
MVPLESEQFPMEPTRLFQKRWVSGTFIALKKYGSRTKPIPRSASAEGFGPSGNTCLLRATDGKRRWAPRKWAGFRWLTPTSGASADGLRKRHKRNADEES